MRTWWRYGRLAHQQLCAVIALAGLAAAGSACTQTGPPGASSTPSGTSCVPSSEQRAALAAYRAKSLDAFVPKGVRKIETVERAADCTKDWPQSRGMVGSAKPFAALETNYETRQPLTSAELSATFGAWAIAAGWRPNGGWDDSQGDGSAYANYCQQIAGEWAAMSVYRGPAVNGTMPMTIVVEGYPGALACPGQPTGG